MSGVALAAGLAALLAAGLARPTAALQDDAPPEVDPYTRGQEKYVERVGYGSFGPFLWVPGATTSAVVEHLGGVPLLWVETEHFRIGSSLASYTIATDQVERNKIEAELKRLSKQLPRVKAGVNELDRWLRLHLFAQRAEELFERFAEDFGVGQDDGPLLPDEKHQLLLCANSSTFARYMQRYHQLPAETPMRVFEPHAGTVLFACAAEQLESFYDNDTALHALVARSVALNLLARLEQAAHAPPVWLAQGVGHVYSRRVDPRYNVFGNAALGSMEDAWDWPPRIRARVKNGDFPSTREMLAWTTRDELDDPTHMLVWGRVDYLFEEHSGDLGPFIKRVCAALPEGEGALVARQERALSEAFDLEPEDFDKAWKRWVDRAYR